MDDVRWIQRLASYRRAVANLEAALRQDSYNDLELQGLIKGFELCYELAWKTLQDLLRERQAFKDGLIDPGDVWQAIHEARNLAAHTYDLDQARRLASGIRSSYAPAFRRLEDRLRKEAAT